MFENDNEGFYTVDKPPHLLYTIPLSFRNAIICMHLYAFTSNYPTLCTNTLASLAKGEVLLPEKIRATTGGIVFLPHYQ